MARRAAWLLVPAALGCACSGAVFTAGPSDGGPSSDATAQDAATTDAPGVADAPPFTVDAGRLDATSGAQPCAMVHKFCDDFENQAAPLGKWGPDDSAMFGGVYRVDDRGNQSAHAFSSATGPVNGGTTATAYTTRIFKDTPAAMTLELDFRIEGSHVPQGTPALAGITLDYGMTSYYALQFAVNGAGRYMIAEFTPPPSKAYVEHDLGVPIATSAWTHVKISFQYPSVANSSISVSFDGQSPVSYPVTPPFPNKPPAIVLGISPLLGPAQPWTVHYDNVTFDTN